MLTGLGRCAQGAAAIFLLASAALAVGQQGQGSPPASEIRALASAHHGSVALYAAQLNGTQEIALDADTPVQTASTIKLALLYEIIEQVRAGTAHWDEPITLPKGYAVGGSGMLHFFDAPLKLTLKDVTTMMIIVSDNTATNLLIDRFTVDAVNARMSALGLANTHLYKRVMMPPTGPTPADQPKFGLGKTTPREIATLMSYIGECKLHPAADQSRSPASHTFLPMDGADRAACSVALDMLKTQFYRDGIPRYLPGGGEGAVANKTGSLDAVRADVALVAGKSGPMVIAIYAYNNTDRSWTDDNEARFTIAKIAKEIVSTWSPAGLDTSIMVPGLGLNASPKP